MSSFSWSPLESSGGGGVTIYANFASFPSAASYPAGTLAVAADTGILYESNGISWQVIAGPGVALSLGAFGSSPNTSGASISGSVLTLQPADATRPGGVSTTTQSFAGNKTFTGSISASNLSGTNTGDITLGSVGNSPAAAGASLSGQVLTLQPADATHPGVLTAGTQQIGGTKQFSQILSSIFSSDTTNPASSGIVRFANNEGISWRDQGNTTDVQLYLNTSNILRMTAALTVTGNILATNFSGSSSGANTGDVTIGTASGLSLVGQALSLGVASAGVTGALSGTDWSTFNSKQATISVGAFGSSPNSSGLSFSGTVLTVQPADATNPGSVSTTTQAFAGTKTFNDNLNVLATTSSVGNYTVAGTRFLHSYGTNNLFLGSGAGNYTLNSTTSAQNVVVGAAAGTGMTGSGANQAADNVLIGYTAGQNLTTGFRNIFVGSLAGSNSNNTTARGNVLIGYNSQANGTSIQDGIAIGTGATLMTSNTMVIGSSTGTINDVYIGKGQSNGTPLTIVGINATGASGLNAAGTDLSLNAGPSTGSGAAGRVIFKTAPVGGSSSTQNVLVTRGGWDGAGGLFINGTSIGTLTLKAAASTTDYTMTFPAAAAAGAVSVNGSGTVSFGTLSIANGGTGQITANAALNALLPSQTSNSGKSLVSNGTDTAWLETSQSQEVINLSIACSVAASALTIALKDKGGSDPSSTSPVKIGFRNSTAATGTYNERSATAATSLVVSSGSTLGMKSATDFYLYVYAIDNSGTIELGVSMTMFPQQSIQSTTAEGGAGAADSNNVIYSTTARSNVPVRLIARLKVNQATAGTWASAPTEISLTPLPTAEVIAFKAYHVGQQTINTNTAYIVFDAADVVYDTHNGFVDANDKWVAPIAGKYKIQARCSAFGSASYAILEYSLNQSTFYRLSVIATQVGLGLWVGGSDTIDLAANDALYLRATTGGNMTLETFYWTIEKIN